MDFKEEIVSVLKQLKAFKIGRREAELELGYSEKSIDQELSRGGNKRMLSGLRLLLTSESLRKSILVANQRISDLENNTQTAESEASYSLRMDKSSQELFERNVQLMKMLAEQRLIIEDLKKIINKADQHLTA